MQISAILNQIDIGSIALPEFQRGYVWNRAQVRRFMNSLYRRHPVGSLLVWETPAATVRMRGSDSRSQDTVKLLLDGQQRITSLYGLIRGEAPGFFEGNANAFTGLRFHLVEETFEFFQPIKMRDDPLWIDVTELLQDGAGVVVGKFLTDPEYQPQIQEFLDRLNRVDGIKTIELHIDQVSGEDKTIDAVVEIFNRVNSGGTKLSKGDLALAKVCASWPEARQEMKSHLDRWRNAGYNFKLELLLRTITTTLTGEASFEALANVNQDDFRQGLTAAVRHIDTLLNIIGSRLGLDHDRVLGGRYALPLMARFLYQQGGRNLEPTRRDQLLYWYVHTFLWGRYAASTETKLNQDLKLIDDSAGNLDGLIGQLRQIRGDLQVHPDDFLSWSRGSRFYPLLYMLTRVWRSLDWELGVELRSNLLGSMSKLELHHIFPKSRLYDAGFSKAQVNALANFTFLTKDTNLKVWKKRPEDYLPVYADKDPELLRSHWIPMDPQLWKIDRYMDFLEARRELLAEAANQFLGTLKQGHVPEQSEHEVEAPIVQRVVSAVVGGIDDKSEEDLLLEINVWVTEQGLAEGEMLFELVEEETGTLFAVLDLAWPNGLQQGLTAPVALLIDEPQETEAAANQAGFRFFTEPDSFRAHVEREILEGSLGGVR